MTQEELKEILDFKNGVFFWKKSFSNRTKIYHRAGTFTSHGYEVICINKKRYYSHSLAYLYHYGFIPKMIDHINNDRLDNHIENLRVCTSLQNNANKSISKINKTGFKGVHLCKNGKYRVQFQTGNLRKHLGYFSDIIKAKEAYQKESIKYFKEFAKV